MHLAQRAFVLILLTAVLAITGVWSSEPEFADLWRIPAALLLLGLAFEAWITRHTELTAIIETVGLAFLGREQAAALTIRNDGTRDAIVQYALAAPAGIDVAGERIRRINAPA